MENSRIKELYQKCDPHKYYSPDAVENIDIDKHYDDCSMLRGYCWARRLFKKVSLGDGSTFQLFTGYSGSGKTTELKRVSKMAEESNYLVVYINADDYIDTYSDVDISDIYSTVIYNCFREVNKLLKKDDNFEDGYYKRFRDFLETEIDLKQIKNRNFVFELKDTKSFRKQVRRYISDNFSTFKKDVRQELDRLNQEVKNNGKDGILVILDSLERNRGNTINHEDVVEASVHLFSNRDYLSLPLDIIYTVPPYLSERIRTQTIEFLPAVKVKTIDNEVFKKGIDLLKELIYYRIPRDDLENILGKNYKEKLEEIIIFSGGYPRDILHILREVLMQDLFPIEDTILKKILQNERNSFEEIINNSLLKYLKDIAKDKNIGMIDEIAVKDNLLNNHLVLRYRNDNRWFDIHPALEKIINK